MRNDLVHEPQQDSPFLYDGEVLIVKRLHGSAAWYLSILSATVVLERFARYLWEEQPILLGQSPNILVVFLGFGLSLSLWVIFNSQQAAKGWLRVFLLTMGIAWVTHLLLYRYHNDAFNYTALLYLPILMMLYVKPPALSAVRISALTLAWTTVLVMVVTRALETLGVLSIKAQPQGIIAFDEERYFLPLNDLIGIDGRWPGPFGHNGDTAMMGALLIVIALAFWTRWSWVFLVIGTLTLVLTNGRASIGAAVAGAIVIAMFSRSARLHWFPRRLRIVAGSALLAGGALVMFGRPAGLTGREKIWPAFLELWLQSPFIGVGGAGIAAGNDVVRFYGHAHSLYIDELSRWGLAGFVTQFAAIGIGVFIAAKAAGIGCPGPLAVIVTYLITGVTEPRNNWIAPSATGFLLILMVVAAAAYLNRTQERELTDLSLTRTTGPDARPGEAASGSSG